jgi:hypothetical protein
MEWSAPRRVCSSVFRSSAARVRRSQRDYSGCSRIALCLIARSARCDIRWVAAAFVGSGGTEKRCPAISLLQIGGANIANPPTSSSLAEKERLCSPDVDCSLRSLSLALLAAAFLARIRSFVQDSGAPVWLSTRAHDPDARSISADLGRRAVAAMATCTVAP